MVSGASSGQSHFKVSLTAEAQSPQRYSCIPAEVRILCVAVVRDALAQEEQGERTFQSRRDCPTANPPLPLCYNPLGRPATNPLRHPSLPPPTTNPIVSLPWKLAWWRWMRQKSYRLGSDAPGGKYSATGISTTLGASWARASLTVSATSSGRST